MGSLNIIAFTSRTKRDRGYFSRITVNKARKAKFSLGRRQRLQMPSPWGRAGAGAGWTSQPRESPAVRVDSPLGSPLPSLCELRLHSPKGLVRRCQSTFLSSKTELRAPFPQEALPAYPPQPDHALCTPVRATVRRHVRCSPQAEPETRAWEWMLRSVGIPGSRGRGWGERSRTGGGGRGGACPQGHRRVHRGLRRACRTPPWRAGGGRRKVPAVLVAGCPRGHGPPTQAALGVWFRGISGCLGSPRGRQKICGGRGETRSQGGGTDTWPFFRQKNKLQLPRQFDWSQRSDLAWPLSPHVWGGRG